MMYDLYIIGWIRIALSFMLKYILGSQGMNEGVVLRCSRPLSWIYLIHIKAKDVGIEPRVYHLYQIALKPKRCVKKQLKNICDC